MTLLSLYFFGLLFIQSFLISISIFSSHYLHNLMKILSSQIANYFAMTSVAFALYIFLFLILWSGFDLIEDRESFIIVLLICIFFGLIFSSLSTSVFCLIPEPWFVNAIAVSVINFIFWLTLEYFIEKNTINDSNIDEILKSFEV